MEYAHSICCLVDDVVPVEDVKCSHPVEHPSIRYLGKIAI